MPALEHPEKYARPAMQQAVADYTVAELLFASNCGRIYGGNPPYDAALAKCQQAVEKALKAILLQYAPQYSSVVFEHELLGEFSPLRDNKQRLWAAVQKILSWLGIRPRLQGQIQKLERLAPSLLRARYASENVVAAMARNTEYPFTDALGNIVAPCIGFASFDVSYHLSALKTVKTLFTQLKRHAKPFSELLEDF